jgi:hypothetical protein
METKNGLLVFLRISATPTLPVAGADELLVPVDAAGAAELVPGAVELVPVVVPLLELLQAARLTAATAATATAPSRWMVLVVVKLMKVPSRVGLSDLRSNRYLAAKTSGQRCPGLFSPGVCTPSTPRT